MIHDGWKIFSENDRSSELQFSVLSTILTFPLCRLFINHRFYDYDFCKYRFFLSQFLLTSLESWLSPPFLRYTLITRRWTKITIYHNILTIIRINKIVVIVVLLRYYYGWRVLILFQVVEFPSLSCIFLHIKKTSCFTPA